jgi:hypothetical protein
MKWKDFGLIFEAHGILCSQSEFAPSKLLHILRTMEPGLNRFTSAHVSKSEQM